MGKRRKKGLNSIPPVAKLDPFFYLDPQFEVIALDCEMVGVAGGPNGSEISSAASVTLIDWNGNILFQSYIRQTMPVTDYRTFVSGITKEDLEDNSNNSNKSLMSLEECRAIIMSCLYNRILVGHGVYNDLQVLGITTHPWWLVRDTAQFELFMWSRTRGKKHNKTVMYYPRKLKHLAKEKLRRDIQLDGRPHNAYEDALAALDLYRLVCRQWEGFITLQWQQDQAKYGNFNRSTQENSYNNNWNYNCSYPMIPQQRNYPGLASLVQPLNLQQYT